MLCVLISFLPLFKSGKINAIAELLEKMLTDLLYHQISPLLLPRQHGFSKSRSSTTNTLTLQLSIKDFQIKCRLNAVKRWSNEFLDPYLTKLLFTSVVRPILKYRSIIWDPCYAFLIINFLFTGSLVKLL